MMPCKDQCTLCLNCSVHAANCPRCSKALCSTSSSWKRLLWTSFARRHRKACARTCQGGGAIRAQKKSLRSTATRCDITEAQQAWQRQPPVVPLSVSNCAGKSAKDAFPEARPRQGESQILVSCLPRVKPRTSASCSCTPACLRSSLAYHERIISCSCPVYSLTPQDGRPQSL
jgi:hypothetical protein